MQTMKEENIVTWPFDGVQIRETDIFTLIEEICNDSKQDVALIDTDAEGDAITYEELYKRSLHIASCLVNNGFKKGSVLASLAYNSIDYVTVTLSVWYLGGAFAGISPQASEDEIRKQLNLCDAEHVYVDETLLERVQSACDRPERIRWYSNGKSNTKHESSTNVDSPPDNDSSHIETIEKMLSYKNMTLAKRPEIDNHQDVAFILFSSGTTGPSKGVQLTHRNIVAVCAQISHPMFFTEDYGQFDIIFQPLSHVFGFQVLIYCLLNKKTTLLMAKFDFAKYLHLISKHKITLLRVVPPILTLFARSPLVNRNNISSITYMCSGSASCGVELQNLVKKRFSKFGLEIPFICQGYGMTETTSLISVSYYDVNAKAEGSIGYVIPGSELKIVSQATGYNLPAYKRGEIQVKGPQVMKGYLKNKKATDEMIDSNGWMKTGDLGYVNSRGELFIVDRIKDIIKYNSYQVSPSEIESILNTHPAVNDAGVYGRLNTIVGELPSAVVILNKGFQESERLVADLMNLVKGKVANYKQLRGGIDFVKYIPRAPSGKVSRNKIKQEMKANL